MIKNEIINVHDWHKKTFKKAFENNMEEVYKAEDIALYSTKEPYYSEWLSRVTPKFEEASKKLANMIDEAVFNKKEV